MPSLIDRMIEVDDATSFAAACWRSSELGKKVGPSTGTNFAGMFELAMEMRNARQCGSIVSLICDDGNRYVDIAGYEMLLEDFSGLGLLNVTLPDIVHREWSTQKSARALGRQPENSYIELLLDYLSPRAGLVTVLDGSPSTLSWLGSVERFQVRPLDIDRFGQTSDLPDIYSR